MTLRSPTRERDTITAFHAACLATNVRPVLVLQDIRHNLAGRTEAEIDRIRDARVTVVKHMLEHGTSSSAILDHIGLIDALTTVRGWRTGR